MTYRRSHRHSSRSRCRPEPAAAVAYMAPAFRQRMPPAPLSPTRPALRFREIAFSFEPPVVESVTYTARSVLCLRRLSHTSTFSGDIAPITATSTRSRALDLNFAVAGFDFETKRPGRTLTSLMVDLRIALHRAVGFRWRIWCWRGCFLSP